MSTFGNLPKTEGPWVRPTAEAPAEPRWGHADGLQIGLAPLPGPRGLIRVYAPYLGHARERVVNFFAIEPTPAGTDERGYSELEWSELDGAPGKRLWSLNDPTDTQPADPLHPARGVVDKDGGVERLTVFIGCERFANGADVYLRATFRADRPHEIAVALFRRDTSVALDRATVSATMGNWARLRRLHLSDRWVTPQELWPGFDGDGFTVHARFGLASMLREPDGAAVVTAEPDEELPVTAAYAEDTRDHWHYLGERATQSWRAADPGPDLEVLVNGRFCYWASQSPIPGGTSFENFELSEPFADGREYAFAVEPMG
ncbi:hypothetical protein [Micromonospora sp. NPDC005367]|uniref:hypothetical protein n=1 Tax=Micromonospora sp. NPDC005367 TaxID=3155590 RepID=UPI00339EEA4D